jgi:SAM-dependent methyltransferase
MTSSPRSFRHWTLRYLIDRTRDRWYQSTHPNDPWLTPISIKFLDAWLKPIDRGLEFGSGRSTLWFARRVTALTSVEHAPVWFERTRRVLAAQGISNVDHRLITGRGSEDPAGYASVADNFAEDSLDFVLVDGIYRDSCAMATLSKLRPGGLLVIDDAHRYLPSRSIAPYARSLAQGPATPLWATFLADVHTWRCLWTSKGVSDTVLYIKP